MFTHLAYCYRPGTQNVNEPGSFVEYHISSFPNLNLVNYVMVVQKQLHSKRSIFLQKEQTNFNQNYLVIIEVFPVVNFFSRLLNMDKTVLTLNTKGNACSYLLKTTFECLLIC